MGVVGDKHISGQHLLHHRMPALLNINDSLFIDGGPDIVISFRNKRKAAKHIQLRHRLGRSLNALHLTCNGVPDFTEHVIFQGDELVLRI